MSYQRITATLRDDIIDRLSDQFKPQFDTLDELEKEIAEKIYGEMMGQNAPIMAALPEGWLPTSGTITINKKDDDFYHAFKLPFPLRFTADKGSYYYNPSPALLEVCKQFRKDKEQVREFKSEALKEARRVIESVTTVNKLVEVWPEIASVLKDIGEDPQPTSQVPAPILDKLNQVLDLPIEEREAA